MKLNNTRNKIILALSLGFISFIIGFFVLFILSGQQNELIRVSHLKNLNEVCDKALQTQSKGLRSLVYDLSYWDEMIIYLRKPNNDWKKANLESITQSYDYDCVWLFNIDQQLKFHTINFKNDASEKLIPKSIFIDLYANHFTNFYIKTDEGILEISGATIHPTADFNRTTSPQGYFFIGRLLDQKYFDDLAQITGSAVHTHLDVNDNTSKNDPSFIMTKRVLNSLDNTPILKIELSKKIPGIKELNHLKTLFTIFFFVLAAIVLLIFSLSFQYWVNKPIKLINNVLKTENRVNLEKLLHNKTEFGRIGVLIDNFLQQKQLLELEIDNRVKIERALIDKEQVYKNLFENAVIGICVSDDEHILNCNQEFLNITGYNSLDEIKKIKKLDIIAPESQETMHWRVALRDKNIEPEHNFIIYLIQKSGDRRKVEVYSRDIKINGKTVQQAVFLDITDRDQAQEKLNKLRVNLEMAQDIAEMGSWEWNIADKKLLITEEFSRITGLNSISNLDQEQIISSIQKNLFPEDFEELKSSLHRMINGEIIENEVELRLKSIDGTIKYLYVKSRIFLNEENQTTAIRGIIQDITFKKMVKQELIRAKEEAEESAKLKSYFLSQMNHELRTPLNGIIGFSSILRNDLQNPDEKEMATSIYHSSYRLLDTLNSIMELTALQTKTMNLKPQSVMLGDLLDNVKKKFEEQIQNSPVTFILENHITKPVMIFPEIISRIIENLIDNALKFTTKGEIKVQTSFIFKANTEHLRLIVKDTGIGIPKHYHDAVFDLFRQVSEGYSRNYEGAGLGLSIVKGYVDLLKGEISLSSEENQGTEFTITIPIAKGETD